MIPIKCLLSELLVLGLCLSLFVLSSRSQCLENVDEPVEQVYVQFEASGMAQNIDIDSRVKLQSNRLNELKKLPNVEWVRPLFTRSARDLLKELQDLDPDGAKELSDLTAWFRIRAADADAAKRLEETLKKSSGVETAYRPTYLGEQGTDILEFFTSLDQSTHQLLREIADVRRKEASNRLKDMSWNQGYLMSAPFGLGLVDVAGWPQVNTAGNVRIGVVEDYWNRYHVDLFGIHDGLAADSDPNHKALAGVCNRMSKHGTNVVGILLAEKNGYGVVGIASGAELVFVYPYVRHDGDKVVYSVADAINRATALLSPGDVLLIEKHIYIIQKPVEVYPACYQAIRHAVAKGIIVVEPAGNGGCSLDDSIRHPDSGAIMVGAAFAWSPQQHPSSLLSRSPIDRTNYGVRVNVQAWGWRAYTTTGNRLLEAYRKLNDGGLSVADDLLRLLNPIGPMHEKPENQDFGTFEDTSAASAVVAGAMVVASSIAKALDPEHKPIAPGKLRELLIQTGSRQVSYRSSEKHIGPQPNLPELLRAIRQELYARHDVPEPSGAAPSLSDDQRWILSLIANGLELKDIAEVIHKREPEVKEIWSDLSEKLGTDSPLAMARAGDHWGLLP